MLGGLPGPQRLLARPGSHPHGNTSRRQYRKASIFIYITHAYFFVTFDTLSHDIILGMACGDVPAKAGPGFWLGCISDRMRAQEAPLR